MTSTPSVNFKPWISFGNWWDRRDDAIFFARGVGELVDHCECGFVRQAALHWKHLRSTNPIESTFAAVLLRGEVVNGLRQGRA